MIPQGTPKDIVPGGTYNTPLTVTYPSTNATRSMHGYLTQLYKDGTTKYLRQRCPTHSNPWAHSGLQGSSVGQILPKVLAAPVG